MGILYFLEWDDDEDPVVNNDWDVSLRRSKCYCGQGCGLVRPRCYGRSVSIPLDRRPRGLTHPAPMALIVRRDLLDFVSPHLAGHIVGSAVWALSGEPIAEYATVYTIASKSIYLRGGPGSRYRVCSWCGLPSLQYDPARRPYITQSQLDGRRAYQMRGSDSIVVTAELRDEIAAAGFVAEWQAYPVRGEAVDGQSFPPG